MALGGVVLALVLLLTGAIVGGGRELGLGAMAGYVLPGEVASVQATWAVPRIQADSPAGVAGTWIGAQAPGAPGPFIQIGTNEECFAPPPGGGLPAQLREPQLGVSGGALTDPVQDGGQCLGSGRPTSNTQYFAFWADTRDGFHPQRLFGVLPGDEVSAGLSLGQGRWRLTLLDRTSGRSARFSTAEEAHASFNLAEWLQEDVVDGATGAPFPYPTLTPVRFRDVEVNAAPPSSSMLDSQWLSAEGRSYGPGPLDGNAFTISRRTVSTLGAQYLRIAAGEDAATHVFVPGMDGWSPSTPRERIAEERGAFARSLRENIRALSDGRWPRAVQDLIRTLVRRTGALLLHVQSAPGMTSAGIEGWTQTWGREAFELGLAGRAIRQRLQLPTYGH